MKYRVLQDVDEQNWKAGDIVSIVGQIAPTPLLEEVAEDTPHQHVLVVADSVLLNNKVQNGIGSI